MLAKMLALLVEEFGLAKVRTTLDEVAKRSDVDSKTRERRGGVPADRKRALDYVLSIKGIDSEQRRLFSILAERFDAREFVPTTGDLKRFMEHHGHRVPTTKNRVDAFRLILKVLSSLPESQVRKVLESRMYSGPVKLDAISDAISESGERVRGRGPSVEDGTKNGSEDVDSSNGRQSHSRRGRSI